MKPGEARPLVGTAFVAGDIVLRGDDERAVVMYVSPWTDYAEVRYADGFTFRTNKSEWRLA